ncbi:MAG TPA: cytochrome c3 family protein, partial [Bacteroidia bacterium]
MKTILLLLALFGIPGLIAAQSIVNSKHNLSIGGPGKVKATTETEVCLFCHTPHNSKPKSPLWNRHDPGSTYTLYNSSTKKAVIGQPSGSSILCLSCHDGTVALGSVLSRVNTISFANTVNMPNGPSNLSTDLRNDHPVSFPYDGSLVKANGHLKNPASLPSNMHLENGELQCTACHDPHKNAYTDFLVMTSQNSTLCLACHEVTNWSTSIHNTSVKTWDSLASAPNPNPWKFTPWKTVADNACENCHNPHNGGATTRLLKYQTEEDNCFDCHNGHVATKNVFNEFNKPYKHNVYAYTSVHDPTESPLVNSKHVECVDCHSSHDMKTLKAAAPLVKGANSGIAGIKQDGSTANPVSYEYEICYRCHSNSAPTGPPTSRKIVQNNQRLEFDPTNPSYHPVAAIGKNTTLVDLITPYSAASQIYCSDCHASDGTNAPAGP